MTHYIISTLLSFILSCKTIHQNWQTLDFKVFELSVPKGWEKFETKGIDSYTGGLTNGKDSLQFDYGLYSPDVKNKDLKTHKLVNDTIKGLYAKIIIPTVPGKGMIAMHIPHVNKNNRLTIYGHNIVEADTVLKIFRSFILKK